MPGPEQDVSAKGKCAAAIVDNVIRGAAVALSVAHHNLTTKHVSDW